MPNEDSANPPPAEPTPEPAAPAQEQPAPARTEVRVEEGKVFAGETAGLIVHPTSFEPVSAPAPGGPPPTQPVPDQAAQQSASPPPDTSE